MNSEWHDFLAANGAAVVDGIVSGFGAPQPDAALSDDSPWMTDVSPLSVLTVEGPDAGEFLHGQFTSDVQALLPGQARMSAWCTPKGRVISTFLLMRGERSYRIVLPAARAAAFLKRLKLFVLRSSVTLVDDADILVCIGAAAPRDIPIANLRLPSLWTLVEADGVSVVGLPGVANPRLLICASATRMRDIWGALAGTLPAVATSRWSMEDILTALPWTAAAGGEQYLPQELGLENIGALSYGKGCYPGQEIVARVHYRGRAKRALYRLSGSGTQPASESELVSSATPDQDAGTIIAVAGNDAQWHALAVLDIDTAGNELRLTGQPQLGIDVTPAH